jgi:antitoxin VapB
MKAAKIFKNGQSQDVRLPMEFRFEGDHGFVKNSGNAIILVPVKKSWDALVDSLAKFQMAS